MNIGKRIKSLRLQKSITQEKLAEYLCISAQAISKWENDITTPDIQLLPKLSSFFGVTIDDLFELSDETQIERIENMLQDNKNISELEYDYALNFLKDKLLDNQYRGRSLTLLSDLHNHKAATNLEKAEYYAIEALKENPTLKENHNALMWAQRGTVKDWNCANHYKRINFYYNFMKENPHYARGYMYLLDELIADGRLSEANEVLLQMKSVDDDCRVNMYEGEIAWAMGNHNEAYEIWENMIKNNPDNWLVYAYTADRFALDCKYDQAIEYNRKAYQLQPSPKYTDAAECTAHIYEIMGDYKQAINAWNELIKQLEVEWQIVEGELVDKPLREINRLIKLIENT